MPPTTNFDITSANATLILTVKDIFPAGIPLQMFASDQAYNMDAIDIAETRIGVDGHLVAGYKPAIHKVSIKLEAPSPSRFSLSTVWEAMATNRRIYECTLVASLPSVGERLIWSTGVLKNGQVVPSAKKVLEATTWKFDFEKLERARI